MRGGDVRTAWVVLAAALMATVPLATAAPAASVDGSEVLLPETMTGTSAPDGIELARQAIDRPGAATASTSQAIEQARRNLDAADAVFDVLDAREDPLAEATRLTEVMTRWQAATLDATLDEPAPRQDAPLPSEAVSTLLERHGVTPSEEQRADIDALDELPEPVRDALADVILRYVGSEEAAERAYEGVTESVASRMLASATFDEGTVRIHPDRAAQLPDPGTVVDRAPILESRIALVQAVEDLQRALDRAQMPQDAQAGDVSVPPVLSLDLDGSDDTYTEDVRVQVDAGGNDTYLNNAGGSNVGQAPCLPSAENPEGLAAKAGSRAALIDLAGDDTYGDGSGFCGVNGGAVAGSGFLVDAGGDDTYLAGIVSNGAAAYFGTGFLLDAAGDDVHRSPRSMTNGGGLGNGVGLMIDPAGDDLHRGYGDGTNGGAIHNSVAALVDGDGNDTYVAAHPSPTSKLGGSGANGGANLDGVGFLVDRAGDDTYRTGREVYTPGGANGGGTRGAVGTLVDGAGDDRYSSTEQGSNGGATYKGLGLLVDLTGNDEYQGTGQGTNGGVLWRGSGTLVDANGDDRYRAQGIGGNGGTRAYGSGLLLDGAGADTYEDRSGGTGTDRTVVPKGTFGAQVDLPNLPG